MMPCRSASVVAWVAIAMGCSGSGPRGDSSDAGLDGDAADRPDVTEIAETSEPDVSECSPGQSRLCYANNMFGTCEATQICNFRYVWDPCPARIPAAEICDGVDNDCDTMVDEDFVCAPRPDFCNLQFPLATATTVGRSTEPVYGRVFEAGLTEPAGASSGVVAELGLGPAGSDPTTSVDWTFVSAAFNLQVGNDDEYVASLSVAAAGTYAYTYRFSLDAGVTYTYCDSDGAGENAGLTFDPALLGTLVVSAPAVDFCNLQFPASTTTTAGVPTESIFGRIFESGVTEPAGPPGGVVAELGFGPAGTDPTTAAGWSFWPATFNVQVGNDDEFTASIVSAATGSYAYTYRFSLDGGASYTYCDLDGAGTNTGLSFDPAQLGSLTVNP